MIIPNLAELVKSAIEETLDDAIGIAFSGGLDSSTIATIAKEHVKPLLFCAGLATSKDMECAPRIAKELGLELIAHEFNEEEILANYKEAYDLCPNELLKVELLVPVIAVCKEAHTKGIKILLFGSGSEELFIGYDRYYKDHEEGKDLEKLLKEEWRLLPQREIAWVKKVCNHFNIEARFPFYNQKLFEFVNTVPLDMRMDDRELKKGLLREAAHLLHVPKEACERRKHAMQYGSGIHKIILKHASELDQKYPQPLFGKK